MIQKIKEKIKGLFIPKINPNKNFNYEKIKKLKLTREQKVKINKLILEQDNKNSTSCVLFFNEILPNGICKVDDNTFSKTIEFSDINYRLANEEDQASIFSNYCELLNYFNEKVNVQLTFINTKTENDLLEKIKIKSKDDSIEHLRKEYYQMLKNQAEKGNNGIKKRKFVTFSVEEENYKKAKAILERIELDVINNFKTMGVLAESLNGKERLEVLHSILNQNEKFNFDYDMVLKTGLTTKNFVAPTSTKNNKTNIEIGNEIASNFYFKIVSKDLEDKILTDFLNIDKKLLINIHLKPFEQTKAIRLAEKKKIEVESQKVKSQKRAIYDGYDMDILPIHLQENINDSNEILEKLKTRDEHFFIVTVIITSFANSIQELEDINNQLKGIAQRHNCTLRTLDYVQEQALNSSLPLGKNWIEIHRSLTTTAVACFVPFITEEISFHSKESLYYGLNALSNNIILADRKELKNPNGLILGTPGSGKSFLAKREMINTILTTEDDIIISDPENEFTGLVNAFSGQVINISPNSKDYINIMDINLEIKDEDPISLKSDFILAFFEQIYSRSLDPIEKSIVDRCVKMVYKEYLKEEKRMPILSDLYKAIKAQNEIESKDLAIALELYTTGSFSYFNNITNINLDNRLISFNIKELGKQLKKVGMLLIQEQIWNKITQNQLLKKSTRTYMDEIHLQLKEEQTANYTIENWKRQRKYGGIPTGMTQNVKDFLASTEVSSILENSDFICMLNQGGGDRNILAKYLNISPVQLSYITDSPAGSGLLKYGSKMVPFYDKFPKETKLYSLMTTKPNEKKE